MNTRAFVIILGVGVVGCLVTSLWENHPAPAVGALPASSSFPSPSRRPVLANGVEPAVLPPAADEAEPGDFPRRRKKVSPADVDLGKALRARILAAMQSEFPAGQDQVDAWLSEWTQRNPASAGRFARSLPTGPWREMIIRRVTQNWAAEDAAGAQRWAARLPDDGERASALADVCLQLAQSDAGQAVEIAERYGLGAAPGAVLENLAQTWAEQDLTKAAAWSGGQPAGEERDQMVGRLAYVQSRTEPAAAANLVVEQMPAGPIQDEAIMSVLHQWALRDPAAAVAWVDRFPTGALHDRAQTELDGLAAYHLLP